MPRHSTISAFLLAGGPSSRMGTDKALLEISGLPMLLRTAQLVAPLVSSLTVLGPPRSAPFNTLSYLPDDTPSLGPLGAISTALHHTRTPWAFILACDLPYLTRPALEFLLSRAASSQSDVILPHSTCGPEPVCALYHQRAAPAIAAALARGTRKITDALAPLKIENIPPSAWKPFDSSARLFKNMNAPADYAEARAYFEQHPDRTAQ